MFPLLAVARTILFQVKINRCLVKKHRVSSLLYSNDVQLASWLFVTVCVCVCRQTSKRTCIGRCLTSVYFLQLKLQMSPHQYEVVQPCRLGSGWRGGSPLIIIQRYGNSKRLTRAYRTKELARVCLPSHQYIHTTNTHMYPYIIEQLTILDYIESRPPSHVAWCPW